MRPSTSTAAVRKRTMGVARRESPGTERETGTAADAALYLQDLHLAAGGSWAPPVASDREVVPPKHSWPPRGNMPCCEVPCC